MILVSDKHIFSSISQARDKSTKEAAPLTSETVDLSDPTRFSCRASEQSDGACRDYEARFCCGEGKMF